MDKYVKYASHYALYVHAMQSGEETYFSIMF